MEATTAAAVTEGNGTAPETAATALGDAEEAPVDAGADTKTPPQESSAETPTVIKAEVMDEPETVAATEAASAPKAEDPVEGDTSDPLSTLASAAAIKAEAGAIKSEPQMPPVTASFFRNRKPL